MSIIRQPKFQFYVLPTLSEYYTELNVRKNQKSRTDNPEILETLGTLDRERRQT